MNNPMLADNSTKDGYNCQGPPHRRRSRPRWCTLRIRRELVWRPTGWGMTTLNIMYIVVVNCHAFFPVGCCWEVPHRKPTELAVLQHSQLLASSHTFSRLDVWLLQRRFRGWGKGRVIGSNTPKKMNLAMNFNTNKSICNTSWNNLRMAAP